MWPLVLKIYMSLRFRSNSKHLFFCFNYSYLFKHSRQDSSYVNVSISFHRAKCHIIIAHYWFFNSLISHSVQYFWQLAASACHAGDLPAELWTQNFLKNILSIAMMAFRVKELEESHPVEITNM